MSAGLSRRRKAAGSEGADVGSAEENHAENRDSGSGGHRIAYDPRDLANGKEKAKQPKLTLMEEVLLLGLKDKQGYLSFWNDNISYALRGCILLELAFRGRISMERDPHRKRFSLADRAIEVVNDKLTGEVLLDEALKMIRATEEKMSVATWIDLMSGETWNLMKIGYQLKQVRERLAKGLVDKGILRTEKKNFLLFDMATHPVVEGQAKEDIVERVGALLTARTPHVPASATLPEDVSLRWLRTVAMVCAAYAANVLENALVNVGHETREGAFGKVDELLEEFSQVPFAIRRTGRGKLAQMVGQEVEELKEPQVEVIGAVLQVFGRLDSW